jgi:iron transport multicopper oxidase
MGNDSMNPAVYGHQTNAIPYPHGANIQLTVFNWDDGFHPFHFHGYVFDPPLFIFNPSLCREPTGVETLVEGVWLIPRHEFQVVSKSFDVTSDDPAVNPPLVEDQKNPARRDTITIPPSGKVVIRWRSDNPGAWFFHCHVSTVVRQDVLCR